MGTWQGGQTSRNSRTSPHLPIHGPPCTRHPSDILPNPLSSGKVPSGFIRGSTLAIEHARAGEDSCSSAHAYEVLQLVVTTAHESFERHVVGRGPHVETYSSGHEQDVEFGGRWNRCVLLLRREESCGCVLRARSLLVVWVEWLLSPRRRILERGLCCGSRITVLWFKNIA